MNLQRPFESTDFWAAVSEVWRIPKSEGRLFLEFAEWNRLAHAAIDCGLIEKTDFQLPAPSERDIWRANGLLSGTGLRLALLRRFNAIAEAKAAGKSAQAAQEEWDDLVQADVAARRLVRKMRDEEYARSRQGTRVRRGSEEGP